MNHDPVSAGSAVSQRSRIDPSPYLVGVGIGILSWVAFGIAKDPLGVTTAYARIASVFAIPFMGSVGVASNTYWKAKPFSLDYGVVFLAGLMLGSFFSALLSRQLRVEVMSEVWHNRFGGSKPRRLLAAFCGGVAVMYGARMAGGCTSGHGISGTLQLAVSSWEFLIIMFAVGAATAALVFGRKGVE